jgi:hypothetical protein
MMKRKNKHPHRIISGGQTGADRGGLDAGRELGLPIGGFCPLGRRAEDGRIPNEYPLEEMETSSYEERTRHNVAEADATILFTGHSIGRGSKLTISTSKQLDQPCLRINIYDALEDNVSIIREWLELHQPDTLNVAGSRESGHPGIHHRTKEILLAALKEND